MLNEEKVVLMTRLAAYEQNKGRENLKINKYFRSDYLLLQMLKTVLYTTFSFVLLLGLYLLYNLESITENLYQMDLIAFVQKIATIYAVFLVICCVVTYLVYSYRYLKAKKSLKEYMKNLKELNAQQ